MPVFNFINQSTESPPKQQLFSIEDYDFLQTNLNSSEWVSAKTALQNSDLFTVINQLSSDLATVKLTAKKKQTQGILDNPSTNASRHGFYQSIFAQLLIGGAMKTDAILNGNLLGRRKLQLIVLSMKMDSIIIFHSKIQKLQQNFMYRKMMFYILGCCQLTAERLE